MNIEKLQQIVADALEKNGVSARQASLDSIGRPDFVRDIKRGVMPSFSNVCRLFEALDLTMDIRDYEGEQVWFNGIVTRDQTTGKRSHGYPPVSENLKNISDFEQGNNSNPIVHIHEIEETDHVLVPKLEVKAAAGVGYINASEDQTHALAFRRGWIQKHNLQLSKLSVIEVDGDSMEPMLTDGDAILVDQRDTGLSIDSVVVALVNNEELLVKRLYYYEETGWILLSDNRAYRPVPLKERDTIVGKVVWHGRWL